MAAFLPMVKISPAGKKGILEELKNLTQLHKLGVSGINQNNSKKLFLAISDLAHLESLSLQVQLDEDNNNLADCLGCISKKTKENLRSLKLYGLKCNFPVWTKELRNLRKLSLQMTVLPQEGINAIADLKNLNKASLFLSEFQDNKLELGSLDLDILEISCNSRLQATITLKSKKVKVLRFRCWGMASLRISGLKDIEFLKEVWLSGPCNEDHKQHFRSEVDNYPVEDEESEPVLRVEEPDSWGYSAAREGHAHLCCLRNPPRRLCRGNIHGLYCSMSPFSPTTLSSTLVFLIKYCKQHRLLF